MSWALPSGSSKYRKLSSRSSNACNLVNLCITYLFCHSHCYCRSSSNTMFSVVLYLDGAGHFISTWTVYWTPYRPNTSTGGGQHSSPRSPKPQALGHAFRSSATVNRFSRPCIRPWSKNENGPGGLMIFPMILRALQGAGNRIRPGGRRG